LPGSIFIGTPEKKVKSQIVFQKKQSQLHFNVIYDQDEGLPDNDE
jgi:hypothetical protein